MDGIEVIALAACIEIAMPISEKDHFDALRAADQRAVELLAQANADRIKTGYLVVAQLIALLSVVVAVAAIFFKH